MHITVTVQLLGSDWGDEEAEEWVLAIVDELREERGALGEVRRFHEEAPPGSKGLGSAILGAFYAILNPKKLRAFLGFIRERLGGRAASLEVVADGRSMRLSLGSADDLSVAVSECIRFVEATAELSPSPTEPAASKEAAISAKTSPAQLPEPRAADPRALGTTTGSSSS